MRTETISVYKFEELSPAAKQRARDDYRNRGYAPSWQTETTDSLKMLFEHCRGVKLADYSLGISGSFVRPKFTSDEIADFSGKRAMAWLENNLLSDLRLGWGKDDRKRCRNYGYRPMSIPPCPFTGYCVDDDYLEALQKHLREGDTLREAFSALAKTCEDILYSEYIYETSDEYIDERLSENEFTESGEEYP